MRGRERERKREEKEREKKGDTREMKEEVRKKWEGGNLSKGNRESERIE